MRLPHRHDGGARRILHLMTALVLPLMSGCAGVSAYISSQAAPGHEINRNAIFYFPVLDKASIDDRKTIQLFVDEFRAQNLGVASEEERALAGYVVSISVDEKTSEITGAFPMSQTQNTTVRNSWGSPVATAQTQSTTYVPYSRSYQVRKIYVYLYSADDIREHKRLLSVWEGYIGVGAEKYSRHSRCIIRELVKRIGVDYESHTEIDEGCLEKTSQHYGPP